MTRFTQHLWRCDHESRIKPMAGNGDDATHLMIDPPPADQYMKDRAAQAPRGGREDLDKAPLGH